jgi:hypothetical protein
MGLNSSSFSIVLFGEAQKGKFQTPYYCDSLVKLSDTLGEPPEEGGRGLDFAVQTILFQFPVIYFRVQEEGYSVEDYFSGLSQLKKKDCFPDVTAICMPGVGNMEIIKATDPVCCVHKSFLIVSQKDLYDFLTN